MVGVFAVLTLVRNQVWKDHVTLLEARMADAPENPWPWFRRAELLVGEGDVQSAGPLLDQALEAMPEFHDARRLRVAVRFATRSYAGAAQDHEVLLGVRPSSRQGWANLALCHAAMGDRRRVDETLERMRRAGCVADEALLAEVERLLSRARR